MNVGLIELQILAWNPYWVTWVSDTKFKQWIQRMLQYSSVFFLGESCIEFMSTKLNITNSFSGGYITDEQDCAYRSHIFTVGKKWKNCLRMDHKGYYIHAGILQENMNIVTKFFVTIKSIQSQYDYCYVFVTVYKQLQYCRHKSLW